MSIIDDGTLVMVFSSMGVATTIALYVVFPLPMALKKIKYTSLEQPETSFAVDIPAWMAVPVYCYNIWGVVYRIAKAALIPWTPFHYSCLMWSYMVGIEFIIIYFLIYMFTRDKRYEEPGEFQAFFCGLFLNMLATGIVVLLYFMDITNVNMFTCILYTVSGIIMYASPLPVLMNRRDMETVQCFPLWISVLFFFNALAWFLVALVASPFDPYFLITNGVGAALGLLNFGIIVQSRWSTEIPRLLISFITRIREKGFLYSVRSMMDIQMDEIAESEEDDFGIQVIVQKDVPLDAA